MKTNGLAFKLSLRIIAGTSFLIFVILFYNYKVSKRLLIESAHETALQLINATVSQIKNMLSAVEKAPEGMALYLENPNLDKETIYDMLSLALKNKPEIFGSCIAFAPYSFFPDRETYAPYCYRTDDGFRFKNLGDDAYQYFKWDWYISAREKGQPVWTEPYFDKGGGNILMSTYAVPFFRKDSLTRIFRGVATADLSLSWLEEMMNSIKIFKSGYVFLVSDKGTIITHPVKENQFKNMSQLVAELSKPELLHAAEDFMEGKRGYVSFKSMVSQKPCLLFFSTLTNTHWHMAVVIPEDELFAGLDRLNIFTILFGIIGIVLLFVVVILFSSQVTKPLRRLTLTATKIGAGNFDVQIKEDHSTLEISMLGNALNRMQLELKEYIKNLELTTAAKEKFESELNIAHDIQQGMIPKIFPPFPGRRDIDIYAVLEPARQVGGDLFDFFLLDDETLCFAIGDVSDKGVPASLMMAITITLFRAKTGINVDVSEIVAGINVDISKDNENFMFVTFFMGILNMRTGELKFCNAGHNYPLLLRKDGQLGSLAETHGVPLGIDELQVYVEGKIVLGKNDTLVLYTDGITEALNVKGELYGDERFEDLIRGRCRGLNARQITETIMNDVAGFTRTPERSDDITLLVLSYYPEVEN